MNTSWRIPRRTFLRGIGTAIALPALESMAPAMKALAAIDSSGAKITAPKRIAFLYIPNGANMADWTPKQVGSEFEPGTA
jgi:hypothetical protein